MTATFDPVGYITVNLTGPAGAQWSLDGGNTWKHSGDSVTVPIGYETITFRPVTGLITPDPQTVDVSLGSTNTVTGVYQATINYVAESEGVISGQKTQTVAYGSATSPVTAIPNPGYSFDRWNDGIMTATRTDNATVGTTLIASFKNTAPRISVVGSSVSVECPDLYTEAAARAGVTVTDDEESLDAADIEISGVTFPLSDLGTYTIRYNIQDSHGLAAEEKTRTVIVKDTTPPSIVISDGNYMELECGTPFVAPEATAMDTCSDELPASILNNNVNVNQAGTYQVTYRGQDASGNNASPETLTVKVVDSGKPFIGLLGGDPAYMECGEAWVDPGFFAQDECEGDITSLVKSNAATQIKNKVPGSYTVTYTVKDGSGNDADPVSRTVIVQDTAPATVIPLGGSQTEVQCGGSYVELGAMAQDVCEGTLPASAISWDSPVDTSVPGTYTVTYTATDSAGNVSTGTRTVLVEDTAPPVFSHFGSEGMVTHFQGEAYTYPTVEAMDDCDGPVAVTREGEVNTDVIGNYVLTYTATDSQNLSVSRSITVQVVSAADPSIMKVEVEDAFSVLVTWNRDLAGIDAALVAANYTVSGSGVGSLSAQPVTVNAVSERVVRLLWDGTSGEMFNGGDIVISVPADFEDNFGNTAGARQGEDSEGAIGLAPVITLVGGDMSLECNVDSYEEPGATAMDNIDGVMEPHLSGYVNTGLPGEYVVAYMAVDAVGNQNVTLRRVTVKDETAPILELLGSAYMEVECGEDFEDPGVTAVDQCDGDLTDDVNVGGQTVDTSVVGASFTITYDLSDSKGNAAPTVTRTVTVVDTAGPVIKLIGDNPLVLDGVTSYHEPGARAVDACGDVDYSDDIEITGDVDPLVVGDYEVTYTVSDNLGNQSRVVREVLVRRKYCDLFYDLQIEPNPAFPGERVVMHVIELPGSCAIGQVHYQWEKRGNNKADTFLPIPGSDDLPMFVLEAADEGDSGQYRCTITDNMVYRHTPVVTLTVGTGVPVAGGLGIALTAVLSLAAGAVALRKKRD